MRLTKLLQVVLFVVIAAAGLVAGWVLFVRFPDSGLQLAGILLVLVFAPLAIKVAGSVAGSVAPGYNVAEVGVDGPITRDGGGGPLSRGPMGTTADSIVEQIEQAGADRGVEALLVRLNTPGGEIVPSEDIKLAAEAFDGPTIGYVTDTCASGGYEIASGCDEIWAREGSIVGSIGVIGSRVTAADLADRLGIQYEGLTAGEYKDAGTPLKDLEEHEREYLQGIVDDFYDQFVENVAQRRGLEAEQIRETEARVYLGTEAHEKGLVDELGTREDVEAALEAELGSDVVVEEFEPDRGIADQLRGTAHRLAYAFGAGIAATLSGDETGITLR